MRFVKTTVRERTPLTVAGLAIYVSQPQAVAAIITKAAVAALMPATK